MIATPRPQTPTTESEPPRRFRLSVAQALGVFPVLVLSSLALVVCGLVSIGLSSHFRNLQEERLHETTQLARATIAQALRDRLRVLADHARMPLIVHGVTQVEANPDLVDLMGTLKVLGSRPRLKILDFEGSTIHSTRPGITFYTGEDWVKCMMGGEKSSHVDLGRSALGAHWVLAVPVLYNDSPEGILVAEVPVTEPLESLPSGPLSGARIELSRGDTVYASLGPVLDEGAVAEHVSEGSLFDLRCKIDRSATNIARERIVFGITVTFIVVALAVTVLSIWAGSRVLGKPLEQLRRSVARISSRGEPADSPDAPGESIECIDEIRALATSFQDMELAIRERETDLRKARDELENRVEERTLELELATRRADSANVAKSVFLAKMSHQIRTPLQSILGVSQLLDDSELDEGQRKCVDVLLRSGASLLELLDDVLDFSRIEAREMTFVETSFCVREVVDSALAMLRLLAEEKSLRFGAAVHDDVPRLVRGDPARLRQVLVNLLSNGIKFTEQGEVCLTVEAVEADVLLFSVRDTGVGIPEDLLEHIFDPFHQGVSATRQSAGSGLGLAVAHEIVQHFGGKLEVESCPEVGSTFAFTARLENASLSEPSTKPEATPESFNGLRVLVAEDNRTNRFVTSKILERLGCDVTMTTNGSEVVESWESGSYDVILMDCHLPSMDGFQATREIRRREKDAPDARIPIIALTASAFAEDRKRCKAAGMDGFVSKPFTRDDLREALGQVAAKS